jgi:signal peptidase I
MLLFSKLRKTRKQAEDWLRLAQRILDYRGDILPPADAAALRTAIADLGTALKNKDTPAATLESQVTAMQPLLTRCGGMFHPRNFWADNIEMVVVAAVIAIGVRTFFFQPFKIPTNSMFPTYNGMTALHYAQPEAAPNPALRAVRFVTLGASHHTLSAGGSGPVFFVPEAEVVAGRKFLVIPSPKRRYTFITGDTPVQIDLPLEFDFSPVIRSMIGAAEPRWQMINGRRVIQTSVEATRGQTFLAFDLLTGDQLFVDRFTYHFRAPRAGEPFVFRTDNIPHIEPENRNKYYIKRVAGVPGDTLEIRPPVLLRNGEPADAAPAFLKNAQTEGLYSGYVVPRSAGNGPPRYPGDRPFTLPPANYFAMGDNSPNSADSRMWGFVPERSIVGKAIFIYYPFSHRWGPAE